MPGASPHRGFIRHFFSAWAWRMAWRDSRASRRRLTLFSASIVLGIAALAAIGSFNENLEQAVASEIRPLMSADLVLASQTPFTAEEEAWFAQLGGTQSREIAGDTMVYFPRTGKSHLVHFRALGQGNLYILGKLETIPLQAADEFRHSGGGAVVEENLLQQVGANIGDEIRLGNFTNRITGRLQKVTGEMDLTSTLMPRVYFSLDDLPRTGLIQDGGLADHLAFFEFAPGTDIPALVKRIQPQLEKFALMHHTREDRQRNLNRAFKNLYSFLSLVSFIALLLGGVGVAGAIHVHVKQKLGTVAVLRCLGGSNSQAFAVYLAQATALGAFGAVVGGLLGVWIQTALPKILTTIIPFTHEFHTWWPAIFRAMVTGFVFCLTFALLPLLTIRQISPLAALRISFEPPTTRHDPLRWLISVILVLGIFGFALMQTRDWRIAAGFVVALGLAFAALTITAKILVRLTRIFALATFPFTARQGIANLHRPNNRTQLLLLSLGLGTFLLMSLYLGQRTLLNQLKADTQNLNAVLYNIQPSQMEATTNLLHSLNLPVLGDLAVVTVRLKSVKGQSADALFSNAKNIVAFNQAIQLNFVTYADQLPADEKIISGTWIPRAPNRTNLVPVSLKQDAATFLGVGLGDELVFEVQGAPITTRIASLRPARQGVAEFSLAVLFPGGVLENVPGIHLIATHVASNEELSRLQNEIIKMFPNVFLLDVDRVVQTVEMLFGKISFVIRFMTMFTVLTGLLVLVSTLATGRYQRIQESVLLRTLGASRAQVFKILIVEYAALGLLAALTGMLLAIEAAWVMAVFVFHTDFVLEAKPLLLALFLVPGVTVVTGLLMSRSVLNHPPLAILRTEV